MDQETKAAFKESVTNSLPALRSHFGQTVEQHLVWVRQGDGQWHGEHQSRPCVREAFIRSHAAIEKACADFISLFRKRHPDHNGMVGTERFGLVNLGHDDTFLTRSALGELWYRYRSFDVPATAVETIANELEEFLDQSSICLQFQALLLNFRMSGDRLELPTGLVVRRLSEEEVTVFYGGPVDAPGLYRAYSGLNEFVIEGTTDEKKLLGTTEFKPAPDPVKVVLDKAMLALRTFKGGAVGYDWIHFRSVKLCTLSRVSRQYGDLHVPFGSYELATDEAEQFRAYAEGLFASSEPAMETACARLADAEIRVRPQDRIVDAVIGMEAMLLAGLAPGDRKSELKYRFSLHYSTLFDTPTERYAAFRVAKDLYDLRSAIAHGSSTGEKVRVGAEKGLTVDEAAKRATQALRKVLHHFLPVHNAAPYRKPDFWDRAYFGLPENS